MWIGVGMYRCESGHRCVVGCGCMYVCSVGV